MSATKTMLIGFTQAYIEAAYFTDTGDTDQPDSGATLSSEGFERAISDCSEFISRIQESGLFAQYCATGKTLDSMAHDFWFSRNGHGVGFWDRGLGELGDKLHDAAKSFGEIALCAGDDGLVYFQ